LEDREQDTDCHAYNAIPESDIRRSLRAIRSSFNQSGGLKDENLAETSPHCPIIYDSQQSFEEEGLTIWNPQVELQFQLQALRIPRKLQFLLQHFNSKEIARPD
jgi:hypothetical protein